MIAHYDIDTDVFSFCRSVKLILSQFVRQLVGR